MSVRTHRAPDLPAQRRPVEAPAVGGADVERVVARLCAAFPQEAPEHVRAVVVAAFDGFSAASVRTYVAILVERQARAALRAGASPVPRAGP